MEKVIDLILFLGAVAGIIMLIVTVFKSSKKKGSVWNTFKSYRKSKKSLARMKNKVILSETPPDTHTVLSIILIDSDLKHIETFFTIGYFALIILVVLSDIVPNTINLAIQFFQAVAGS